VAEQEGLDMRHDAFISYRHVRRDRRWAKWLHKRLENYRTPKQLVAQGIKKRLERVFRDEEELAASPSLPASIREELEASEHLIVICSPEAVCSKWIDSEIEYFHGLGRGDQIVSVLIRGTPETAFPHALRRVRSEQILDSEGDPLAVSLPTGLFAYFQRRLALLKVLASLLSCRFDDLRRRHEKRRRRRSLTVAGVIAAATLVAAVSFLRYQVRAIEELNTYAQDSLKRDASRSVLLGRVALERARWVERITNRFGIPHDEAVRKTLEEAISYSHLRGEFLMPREPVQAVAWDMSDHLLAGDYDGNVHVWIRSSGELLSQRLFANGIQRMALRAGGPLMVAMVTGQKQKLADGTTILSFGAEERDLHVWNFAVNALRSARLSTDDLTNEAAVSWCSRTDEIVASSGLDRAWVWQAVDDTLHIITELSDVRGAQNSSWGQVNALAWNGDCRVVAVGTSAGLYFWHPESRQSTMIAPAAGVSANVDQRTVKGFLAVDWNSDSTMLAVGGQDQTVRLFRANGELDQVLSNHQGAVKVVRWNHKGNRLATAGADGVILVWERSESALFEAMVGFYANQGGYVSGLAWSSDDTELASVGDARTVRIWNVSTLAQPVALSSRRGLLRADGKHRLTLDDQRLTDDELAELARQRTLRPFSSDECENYLHAACPTMP
jgi:WD40 repeat protein